MSFLKLKSQRHLGSQPMNGRAYFQAAAREMGISDLDPVEVQRGSGGKDFKRGKKESRVGGWIARNLKHLTPEETAERRRRSEEFLKQADQVFPAEEESQSENIRK
jgi:hypothetical protein